jgi:hypothetical protein
MRGSKSGGSPHAAVSVYRGRDHRIIAESELPTAGIAGTARKYGIKEATLYR